MEQRGSQNEPELAFVVAEPESPAIEVRVNFGVFAGRAATPAEIDRLAEWLLDEVGDVSIVAEERHELNAEGEASVHQVCVKLGTDAVPSDASGRAELAQRIAERADYWARLCISDRHTTAAE